MISNSPIQNLGRKSVARARKSSVLLATIVLVTVIFVIVGSVLTQSQGSVRYGSQQLKQRRLNAAALGGIETVRAFVSSANYTAAGNAWLRTPGNVMTDGIQNPNSAEPETLPPLAELRRAARSRSPLFSANPALTFNVGAVEVRCYVYETKTALFRAIAIATDPRTGQSVTKALNFRERASFARYIFFRDQRIRFGATTTDGEIHVNNDIFFSEPYQSFGPTTATGRFRYTVNANSSNVQFFDFSEQRSDFRERPTVSELSSLKNGILPSNSPYLMPRDLSSSSYWRQNYELARIDSVQKIHFQGSDVVLQVQGRNVNGQTVTTPEVTLPLPQEGLIFTDRQVKSMQGELNGRVTVAVDFGNEANQRPGPSNESIRLTGPVQYVDKDGEHPYELYQVTQSGEKIGKVGLQESGNAVWSQENGYVYEKNQSYLASGTELPPALGIIAKGRIRMTENAPFNMVFHSAQVSINSTWTSTYWPTLAEGNPHYTTLRRGNFRHLGAKVEKGGQGGRYARVGRYPYPGYSLSGEYIFDKRLRSLPPPHFVSEDRPAYGQTYNPVRGTVNTQ